MKLIEVADESEDFETVLRLWRMESDTLGNMPRGGFSDAARARCLVAAKDRDGTLGGYVMFRRLARRGDASITHLCVAKIARGKGVAELLFDRVKALCSNCFDIRLRCRRDFAAANRLWQRLGFTALLDAPGRGRDGRLTTWRYPLAELPLLRRLADADEAGDDRVRAVIDANVFFDLDDLAPGSEESRALTADWLDDFVALHVTEELLNEINRREPQVDRERQRQRATTFQMVRRDTTREDIHVGAIRTVLSCKSENQLSDVRQLAMTAAAEVPFFVTRDEDFLNAADTLHELTQVRIVRPFELSVRFDELRREEEYRPERLFLGPEVTSSLARPDDVDRIAALMHDGQPPPEGLDRTRARLRTFLSAPERYEVRRVTAGDELLAAYVLERSDDAMRVPFFGVRHSSLGRTAARHWGDAIVAVATRENRRVIRVEPAGRRIGEALAELGFEQDKDGWVKVGLREILGPDEMALALAVVGSKHPDASAVTARVGDALRTMARAAPDSRQHCAEVERALWPAKLTGTALPSFIVPIQPRWAKDLFDQELARGTLFGADPSLALNCENVYYRAASPAVLSGPSRVLWYVSDDRKNYPTSMAVRACSQIDEVVIGPAKDLFRRFRRLGIYKWSDIDAIGNGDQTKEVMAFRFSKTELFRRPLGWTELQTVLKRASGKRSPLVSPIEISESTFVEIYRHGVRDAA
jgi:GNAT superfamily N-acetyltransferase